MIRRFFRSIRRSLGPLYRGDRAYQDQDFVYRQNFRHATQADLKRAIGEAFEKIYGNDFHWKGLEKRGAISPVSQFLGVLKEKLLDIEPEISRTRLTHKLRWSSLEFFFATQASLLDGECLLFDFRFYCASALAALNTLLVDCDDRRLIPYIFIATTQLPNEFIMLGEDKDKGIYAKAKENYLEHFVKLIESRENVDDPLNHGKKIDLPLVVERHILATEEPKDAPSDVRFQEENKYLPYLAPQYQWRRGVDGQLLDDAIDPVRTKDAKSAFNKWLRKNHCWRTTQSRSRPNEGAAWLNIINGIEPFLPVDGSNKVKLPKDEDMCIDLIAFGAAEEKPIGQGEFKLVVSWDFGIGVFAAAQPEKLEGRYIKLLSHSVLHGLDKQSRDVGAGTSREFSFLGYKAGSFKKLFEAMHNEANSLTESQIRPAKSVPLVSVAPWKGWADSAVPSSVATMGFPTIEFSEVDSLSATDKEDVAVGFLSLFTTKRGRRDALLATFAAAAVIVPISGIGALAAALYGHPVEPWDTVAGAVAFSLVIATIILFFRRRKK